MKISAVYLTKNEQEFLPLSVQTVLKHVDEVIIIDTRSTDRTLELAKVIEHQNPSKVRVLSWDTDFDESCEFACRNKAIKEATGDWLMILDADQLMSDNWIDYVKPLMLKRDVDSVAVLYEHLVGSYEYIHQSFYEKQHDPKKHPEVPLYQTVLFRKTPALLARAAADTCPQFRPQHHARFDESVPHQKAWKTANATVFHYGFAKRNMMYMAKYRIQRGDYGHEPERKADLIAQLDASGNPFKFIGNVHRVDYGPEYVPTVMREAFDTTYRLEIDDKGFIQKRTLIATGEAL